MKKVIIWLLVIAIIAVGAWLIFRDGEEAYTPDEQETTAWDGSYGAAPMASMEMVREGFAGGIPSEVVEVTITPRDINGYPWLAEIAFIPEDEMDALIAEYGAFEFAFQPVTLDDGMITWTRYEIQATPGLNYSFVSWFAGDTMVRGQFESLWLPLVGTNDVSPARYLLFADSNGTATLTTFTYTFRNWDEISSAIGLFESMEETAALNTPFPRAGVPEPEAGWARAPWSSETVVEFMVP